MHMNATKCDEEELKIAYLFKKYRFLMFEKAYEILRDEYLAEDAVQQSFVRIMKNIHKIQDADSHKTRAFLVIICRNIAINMYHKCIKNAQHYEDAVENSYIDPLDIVIDNIVQRQTVDYIHKLKPIYQEILILRYYFDYDYDTIASLLHISNDMARKRFERGKGELLKLLNKDGLYDKK